MRASLQELAVLVTLGSVFAGCNSGSSGSGSATGGISAVETTVTGDASYEKLRVDPLTAALSPTPALEPIRHARVDVLSGTSVVGSGSTDALGQFVVRYPAALRGTPLVLRVEARSGLDWAPLTVSDAGGAIHALSAATTGDAPVSLVAPAAAASSRAAGAFNILDQLLRGMELVRSVDPAAVMPALSAVWTPGGANRSSTSFDRTRMTLDVLDDPAADLDCFDDSVLLHELGHYMQTAFSGDSTPGGVHLGCGGGLAQVLDYRLAFAEGWASVFGQTVLGDARYVDTRVGAPGFVLDLERPCTRALGPGSESAIHGLLWDVIDGAAVPSSDADAVALGFAPVWQAMRALKVVPHAYVRDLRDALVSASAVTPAAWDGAASTLGLAGSIANLAATIQPGVLYQDRVDASLGQDSLRAANGYYFVTLTAPAATLTVTLDPVDAARDELDLILRGPDGTIYVSQNARASERVVFATPGPGTYLVRVRARDGVIGSSTASFTFQAVVQ